MIQKLVLQIRYERSSISMKSHLDVSVPVIMVLDLESGLHSVRRLIVNRSVEGRERHQAPLTIIANEVKQSKFL